MSEASPACALERTSPNGATTTTPKQHRTGGSRHGEQLCRRLATVEKIRNCRDELCGSERLFQHDAVWYAFRGPIRRCGSAHVDDGKIRFDLSGVLGDFPAVHFAFQIDVGRECSIFAFVVP
jgi:hypothetical protein